VEAISLNYGEVVYLAQGPEGTRIGWDLSGVIERAAADGTGPARGARVVAGIPTGSWAESVAVPTNALAELPVTVSFSQAAALPCAGLTALHAVEHGGNLLARSVLVTGASGGVGLFACRLAALAGARVVAQVRRAESASLVHETGAEHVVVNEDVAAAAEFGPYHLIIDQLGGQVLAEAMSLLVMGGKCVSVGGTAGHEVLLDMQLMRQRMQQTPGVSLDFFNLYFEFIRQPVAIGLQRLVYLVATGKLAPHIGMEADWGEVGRVAQALLDRQFSGKAILQIRR
jgi:NADPH:quinone reductase-like Zn-dependent oxidoreductase